MNMQIEQLYLSPSWETLAKHNQFGVWFFLLTKIFCKLSFLHQVPNCAWTLLKLNTTSYGPSLHLPVGVERATAEDLQVLQQVLGRWAQESWEEAQKRAVASQKKVDLIFSGWWEGGEQEPTGLRVRPGACFPFWRMLSFACVPRGLLNPAVYWKEWESL